MRGLLPPMASALQQLGHPMLCMEEVPFWLCFQEHHWGLESRRVCWSLTLAMALPAQSEGLAAHEEITLLFSRIWPEAALEPLCFDATLSTIHVGNGSSKCSTLTLWSTPQTPPLLLHSSTPLSHYKMCLIISRESRHFLTAQLPHV